MMHHLNKELHSEKLDHILPYNNHLWFKLGDKICCEFLVPLNYRTDASIVPYSSKSPPPSSGQKSENSEVPCIVPCVKIGYQIDQLSELVPNSAAC